ncbi:YrrS family protein [Bacillus sp. Marseille-P3661]|uniref:YrrS family protein n=1 Tax=Bacillus sp. Marseille-P3661 TaxID=1936234 RepID=UPI000C82C105|nr:YrrS family protein [Bacillus sp. Marseille-P3661]
MKYDFEDLYEGPRFQNKARRRKMKLIVSGVIGILGLVVLITVISLFTQDSEVAVPVDETQVASQEEKVENNEDIENSKSPEENTNNIESDNSAHNDITAVSEEIETESDKLETEHDNNINTQDFQDEENVIQVIEEDWETTATTQEGPHVTDFTKGSQDWEEMMSAITTATGLSKDSMIVWWLGNGGGPDKAVSTISTKDQQSYYRVQLEWVQNKGWKPVSVEELAENDRLPKTDHNEVSE